MESNGDAELPACADQNLDFRAGQSWVHDESRLARPLSILETGWLRTAEVRGWRGRFDITDDCRRNHIRCVALYQDNWSDSFNRVLRR
jgi:hypothetical protein